MAQMLRGELLVCLQAEEGWSRCRQWHFPCYLKPAPVGPPPLSPTTPTLESAQNSPRANPSRGHQARKAGADNSRALPESPVGDSPGREQAVASGQVVHLDVATCAVMPHVTLKGEAATWEADKGIWQVDFGKPPW